MKTYPNLGNFIRYAGILLIYIFFQSFVFPVSPVHGAEGDFVWAEPIGGPGNDRGHSVVADTSGNVYTTGYFNGTVDFDPGPGIFNLASLNSTNAVFISKLDSKGDFVWAKAIAGQFSCIGYGITVDTSGNIYTTGFFWGTVDFDPGPGIFNLTSTGWSDVFVCKLDSNGNFVWARHMGGTLYDNGYGIAVDASGNVFVTGYFQGTADFDPGPLTFNLNSESGSSDIFISELDSNGDFVWAKGFGGTENETGFGVSVDRSGNVFTTGYFSGTVDFDPGAGTVNLTSAGAASDIFISKLDSNGGFAWARAFSGNLGGEGHGISVGASGNVYTTGNFTGTIDFDPGPGSFNLISDAGSQDIFISKLTGNGDFLWARAIGGPLIDSGDGISVDISGNVYTTGSFSDTADFDPAPGTTFNLSSEGWYDIFISKLTGNGDFAWAKAIGGILDEMGKGIFADKTGNVYATGTFRGLVDFDPGPGTFNLTSNGDTDDIFIVYLSGPPSSFPWPMFLPAISGGSQQ